MREYVRFTFLKWWFGIEDVSDVFVRKRVITLDLDLAIDINVWI